MTPRQTPDAVREASPNVAGPIWPEADDDCFTAEIQTVGGHSVIATVHGSTRDEAERRQLAILAALDSRAGDAGEGWQPIETAVLWDVYVVTDGVNAAMSQYAESDLGYPYWAVEPEDALEWEPTHCIKAPASHASDGGKA